MMNWENLEFPIIYSTSLHVGGGHDQKSVLKSCELWVLMTTKQALFCHGSHWEHFQKLQLINTVRHAVSKWI